MVEARSDPEATEDPDPPSPTDREAWLASVFGDIDPARYAGEGFGATEEYFPQDIDDPHVRGEVTEPEGYYPGADRKRRKWPPYR